MNLPDLLGNPMAAWLAAGKLSLAAFLLAWLLRAVALRRLARIAERTTTDLDDFLVELLRRTRLWLLVFPALALGALQLELPARLDRLLLVATTLAVFAQIGLWGGALVDYLVQRARKSDGGPSATTLTALGFAGKLVLWSLVLVIALDNLGVNVTALVAGLGVGGVAIGLATQNILGDLFSSLSIVIDKPFEVGDAITVGEFSGTVEHIGLKTTRLRAISGEQVVFANGDLLQSRIRNLRRMEERRIAVNLGVTYDTDPEQVAALPEELRRLVEAVPGLRFDRAHFRSFAPSALDLELVYWVETPELGTALDAQQAVNLAILRRFAALGVRFAYPTQTVHLARSGPAEPRDHRPAV
jgi:small-conductance mechanosensitive channel